MAIKHGVFLILLVIDLILSGIFLGLPGFIIPSGIQDYEHNTEVCVKTLIFTYINII